MMAALLIINNRDFEITVNVQFLLTHFIILITKILSICLYAKYCATLRVIQSILRIVMLDWLKAQIFYETRKQFQYLYKNCRIAN